MLLCHHNYAERGSPSQIFQLCVVGGLSLQSTQRRPSHRTAYGVWVNFSSARSDEQC